MVSHNNRWFLVLHSWCFGAIYCCCRLLVATFMTLSLGEFLLLATAVAVYLFSWCLRARSCCEFSSLAVLAMLSLGNLALFAAAVAVY
ncbi:hypothetical protein MAM1_0021d01824 [Mucor ambiguus]|uniref:Uncharacterized protein n=1 Tax=Mucor ambiguus TaxID=91626 RepID=A0A0C9M1P3_9FUNG|nr:hypothetical protein MAM1_0021d01824 [Mucor ambiguus]